MYDSAVSWEISEYEMWRAENIRDTFSALQKTSYDLQQSNEGGVETEEDHQTRFFYQTTKEVFSKWAH